MIRKIEKTYTTTYVYKLSDDTTCASAVEWICGVVNSECISTKKIVLQDKQRGSDEGNLSVEIFPPFVAAEILEQIVRRDIDCIVLSGLLHQIPVGFNLNLRSFEVGVAMDNPPALEVELIETVLQLN